MRESEVENLVLAALEAIEDHFTSGCLAMTPSCLEGPVREAIEAAAARQSRPQPDPSGKGR